MAGFALGLSGVVGKGCSGANGAATEAGGDEGGGGGVIIIIFCGSAGVAPIVVPFVVVV